jgi:hypothetical protein
MSKLMEIRRRGGGGGGTLNQIIIEEIQVPQVSLENEDVVAIEKCQVVYSDVDGKINRARAHSLITAKAIGFASSNIDIGASGFIRVDGVLDADQPLWNAVIEEGSVVGLSPGTIYYLSAITPGFITAVAPSDPGLYVVAIGRALTSTIMKIEVEYPIEN